MSEKNNYYGFVSESQPLGVISPNLPDEEAEIQQEFEGLLVDYQHTRNGDKEEMIRRAFNFAKEAHKDDRRQNGVPYICQRIYEIIVFALTGGRAGNKAE